MRSKSREPGNQETKTTTKTKTKTNTRSARLFQMFPLLLLLNATNPASTTQTDFFAIFFPSDVFGSPVLINWGLVDPIPALAPHLILLCWITVQLQFNEMIVVIRYKRNGKVDPPDPLICPCFLKVYNHRESEKGVPRI